MDSTNKYKLEEAIREIIYDDNKNSAHFEYTERKYAGDIEVKVKVITLNKKTGASFLLSEAKANTAELALEEIENELLVSNSDYHTYTIKWYEKGQPASRPYKSKFKSKNIIKAIEKFYYGKNNDSLIIYSISDDNVKSKDYEG